MSVALADHPRLIDEQVLRAWRPIPRTRPSAWAADNVVLPLDSPIPGPLDHANAPYLAGIIDVCDARGVAQVNVQKAAQIGVSAAMRWLIGYWAMHDPAPAGLTLPDKEKGRKIVAGDVIPFFRDTAVLRAMMTRKAMDESSETLRLPNGFTLHLMWSGSASSTASFPMKRVVLDEVDKMRAWGRGGGEGHAVHRTRKRLRVYRDAAVQVNVSTPHTSHHLMHQLVRGSSVNLRYLVPCPHCGTRIRLAWDRVKWQHYPREERGSNEAWADRILAEHAAWYLCQACDAPITELHRRAAVQLGLWGTCDDLGIADGRITDAASVAEWPAGTSLGIQISALYCTWITLEKLAHEYIRALDSVEAMFTFRTETLGEAYEETRSRVRVEDIRERQLQAPRAEGVVPAWAACVIATIDTQADHFWFVVRAWGPEMRSARVGHGRLESFADIDRVLLAGRWGNEDPRLPPWGVDMVLIDSGGTRREGATLSRTMEVYGWALQHEQLVRAIKGAQKPMPGIFFRRTRGWLDPGGDGRKRIEVPLWLLDTHHYQDTLAALMQRRIIRRSEDGEQSEQPAWELNARDDPEYAAHMANMAKVATREGDGMTESWRPVSEHARIDLRDCEGYQVAGAYMMHMHLLPPTEQFMAMREQELQAVREHRPAARTGGYTLPGGRPWFG